MTNPVTTEMIWYNPDLDLYQKGNTKEFLSLTTQSDNPNRFLVMHQFQESKTALANEVLDSFNSARKEKLALV